MNNASMTLHPLTVGQFYGTPKPRGEGFHVMGLSLERAEVLCSYANLGPDEVQGWKDTPITAGLGAIMELGVLCLKDGISSGDAPYDIRAGHPGEQTPPPPGYLLTTFILLEAETGRIRAIRAVTMSPGFVSLLNGLCQNQLATPFNRGRYDFLINAYRDKPNEYWWRSAGIVEELGITTPAPASAGLADTQADLQGRFPGLDPRVVEVMANLIATEGAVVVERDGVAWWVDPGFGEDAPVLSLGYDETLGMVDRRRHPEPGKA